MPDNPRMPRDTPPANIRERPHLGVEVHDDSTLLRSQLALSSNWFAVGGLDITRRKGEVRLHRDGQVVARSDGNVLFLAGRPLHLRQAGFWRPVWTATLDDGRLVEVTTGRHGIYKHVRVMPGDVRLEVVDTSSGFGRACRVNLVSGLIETELALGFLVYFLAELEAAYRDRS